MFPLPRFVPEDYLRGAALADGAPLLGVIGFDAPRPAMLDAAVPFARVAMRMLGGAGPYEAWTCAAPVLRHDACGVDLAVAGGYAFGVVRVAPGADDAPQAFARDAYARLFAGARHAGCPHVLRVYNYLPRITALQNGIERYRLFNAGRWEAFEACGRADTGAPAACALGIDGGAPVIYFLASRAPGRPVENPRQLSAYRYPACYGARSPTFSRAMAAGAPPHLLISGTASIVGHASVHIGDAGAQTAETLRNLSAVMQAAGGGTLAQAAPSLALKVYVRHPADLAAVTGGLAVLPAFAATMVLQAEICRETLLVEIEACGPLREAAADASTA